MIATTAFGNGWQNQCGSSLKFKHHTRRRINIFGGATVCKKKKTFCLSMPFSECCLVFYSEGGVQMSGGSGRVNRCCVRVSLVLRGSYRSNWSCIVSQVLVLEGRTPQQRQTGCTKWPPARMVKCASRRGWRAHQKGKGLSAIRTCATAHICCDHLCLPHEGSIRMSGLRQVSRRSCLPKGGFPVYTVLVHPSREIVIALALGTPVNVYGENGQQDRR